MAILNVDAFRGKMTGGGARANMFEVNVNFPAAAGGDTELTNFMCRGAQIPAAAVESVSVPFRGRIVKFPGDRTFEDWTMTVDEVQEKDGLLIYVGVRTDNDEPVALKEVFLNNFIKFKRNFTHFCSEF